MESIIIILSVLGFCRTFYFAIGEPNGYEINQQAIFYSYTDFTSKMICKIHKIEYHKENVAYNLAENLINKYYKFLGFCYICFSTWIGFIFCLLYFNTIKEKATYLGLYLLTNFIIRKWTF